MLALTLHYPWPYAFAVAGKDIENRKWCPSPNRLAIGDVFALHGGQKEPNETESKRSAQFVVEAFAISQVRPASYYRFPDRDEADIRGIFALAIFGGVVSESDSPWFVGPLGWRIRVAHVLPEPIPCKGKQGLWIVPKPIATDLLTFFG